MLKAATRYFDWRIARTPIEQEKLNIEKPVKVAEAERKAERIEDVGRKRDDRRDENEAQHKFKKQFGHGWRKAWDNMSEDERDKYYYHESN